jgi:putative oxidoreductase
MSVIRFAGRSFLAGIFVSGGLDAVRQPDSKVKAAEPVATPIAQRVPGLPRDTKTLVRINGAVMMGAGTLLAVGKFRRLAAVALIGSILPTTLAGHRFWEESDEATRAEQRVHFLKNLGLAGGLILEAMDTEGNPSLGWWAKREARHVRAVAATSKPKAGRVAARTAKRTKAAARPALSSGAHRAGEVWSTVAEHLPVG